MSGEDPGFLIALKFMAIKLTANSHCLMETKKKKKSKSSLSTEGDMFSKLSAVSVTWVGFLSRDLRPFSKSLHFILG